MKFKSDIEVQAGLRDGSDDIGTAGQILSSTGSQTNWIDQGTIISAASKLVVIACKNTSGATITKGTPVYQTGTVGATDVIEIAEADASDEDKMAAIGLLQTDINNNDFGNVVITGELLNFTTDPIDGVTPTTGDTVYVKSGGGLTLTKPTGLEFIQNVGLVGKVSGGNAGSITVSSIMRSNDVPTPLYIDHANQRLGIGTDSPSEELEVAGTQPRISLNDTSSTVGGMLSLIEFDATDGRAGYIGAINSDMYVSSIADILLAPTGNVGIGTTSPDGLLHVSSGTSGDALVIIESDTDNNDENDNPQLQFKQDGGNTIAKIGLSGDAGTIFTNSLANTAYFGNDEAASVQLYTNATARLTIESGGDVGIGTTNPGAKLDVDGNILISDTDNDKYFGSNVNLILNADADANSGDSARNIIFQNRGSEKMRIDANGNVGIGMTDPAANLHVESTNDGMTNGINTNQLKLSYGASVNGAGSSIAFGVSAVSNFTGAKIVHERKGSNSVGDLSFWTRSTGGINTDYDLTVERMRISSSGNVGIGTTSPDYLLDLYKSTDTTSSSTGTTLQRLWNYVGSDLNQQKTFVDFVFQDDNNNEYPQVRIGAEVGQNGNSDTQQKEGSGAFVVYTNNATGDGPGTPTGLAERFRVDYSGNVGIGTTDPGSLLHVEGSRTTAVFQANQTGTGVIANFKQAGNSKVLIDNAGNVGINTTSPDFKLDVDGTFGVSDLPFNTDSVSVLVADETIGAELITNGNFATDSDWSKGPGWTISGGTANAVSATSEPMAQTVSGFAAGNIYKVRFEVTAVTNGYIRVYAYAGASGTFTNIFSSPELTTGVYEGTFEFGGTNKILRFYGSTGSAGGFAGSIDNISVKQVTSASNQIQKRELGTGAFGPTPVGAYLPLSAGSGSPLTGDLYLGDFNKISGVTGDNLVIGVDTNNSSGASSFDIQMDGSTSAFYINNSRQVGIGTTSIANAKLKVSGGGVDIESATDSLRLRFYEGAAFKSGIQQVLSIGEMITASAVGDMAIRANAGNLLFATGGSTERMRIDSSGKVGIGTVLPSEKLDVNGNIKIKSALLSKQEELDASIGVNVIANVAIATYTAAFFDFVIKKVGNIRSGTVYACHDGTNVEFTETSTNDLGNTSDVTLSVDISGANMRLIATTISDEWEIKSLIRAI